jgi:hypothetical protein
MALALLAVITACPAMACTMTAGAFGHSCCHKHQNPTGSMRNCPYLLLEKGKAELPLAAAFAAPAGMPRPAAACRVEPQAVPAAVAIPQDLYLRNRVLLI